MHTHIHSNTLIGKQVSARARTHTHTHIVQNVVQVMHAELHAKMLEPKCKMLKQ